MGEYFDLATCSVYLCFVKVILRKYIAGLTFSLELSKKRSESFVQWCNVQIARIKYFTSFICCPASQMITSFATSTVAILQPTLWSNSNFVEDVV